MHEATSHEDMVRRSITHGDAEDALAENARLREEVRRLRQRVESLTRELADCYARREQEAQQ